MQRIAVVPGSCVIPVKERFVDLHAVYVTVMPRAGRSLRVPVQRKAEVGEEREEALADHGRQRVARIVKQVDELRVDVDVHIDRPRVVRSNSANQRERGRRTRAFRTRRSRTRADTPLSASSSDPACSRKAQRAAATARFRTFRAQAARRREASGKRRIPRWGRSEAFRGRTTRRPVRRGASKRGIGARDWRTRPRR